MTIQDLKIGDYVLYKNEPYKIWSLNGTIACIEPKRGKIRGVLIESLAPIHLTFDILTKCGWSRTADEMCSMPFAFGRLNVVDCVLAGVYDDMAAIALCEAREHDTTNQTKNAMREQLEYLIANNCKLDYNELKNNIQ